MGKSVFAALAALVLVACGSETGPVFGNGDGGSSSTSAVGVGGAGGREATGTLCVPGQSIACVGPAGCAGGQVCADDGSSYGVCVCGGAGGAGSNSSSSSTGSTTGGAQCIFSNGCEKVDGNIGCSGIKGEQGFTIEYKNCDTVPSCCVPTTEYMGDEYYCCKP